ncbi:hypothetical protein U1Q18_002042 [Sarracenia purpurea var. burkii]
MEEILGAFLFNEIREEEGGAHGDEIVEETRTVKKLKKHGGAVGVHQSPEVVFSRITGDLRGRRKASERITEHSGGEAAGVASWRMRETNERSYVHSNLEIALESKRARSTGAKNCSVIGAKKTK